MSILFNGDQTWEVPDNIPDRVIKQYENASYANKQPSNPVISGDSRPDTQGGPTCIMVLYGHSVRKFSGGSGGATPRSYRIFAILRLKNGLKLMLKT